MKNLVLIAGMLLMLTAKLVAQENTGIEVKSFQTQSNGVQKENHQFEIVAHDDVNVNLKFSLKTEDQINVVITDKSNREVLTKTLDKPGLNKLDFTMEENEKYLVKLIGEKQSNLIVQVSEND